MSDDILHQMLDKMTSEVCRLSLMNDFLLEAIRKVIEDGVQKTEGPYSWKNNLCRHGRSGSEGCEECIIEFLEQTVADAKGEDFKPYPHPAPEQP